MEKEEPTPRKKKTHLTGNKWLRGGVKTLMWAIVIIVLLPAIIYIPPVQTLLVRTATNILAEKTGMKIGIEKFRLKFPLDVSLRKVSVVEATGDTMVMASEVVADLKLIPLLSLDAQINRLELVDAQYRLQSADSSMLMKIKAGRLQIDDKSNANIKTGDINLEEVYLSDGDITLIMDVWKKTAAPSDTASTPFCIKARKLKLDNFRFTMSMLPTIDTLQFASTNMLIENGLIDLRNSKMKIGTVAAASGFAGMTMPSVEFVKQHPAPVSDNSDSSTPFAIDIDTITLTQFNARYAVEDSAPAAGFDPNDIRVEGLDISVGGFHNEATDIVLPIKSIEGRLLMADCGASAEGRWNAIKILNESRGLFSMDSSGIRLDDFHIVTESSLIDATAAIPNDLLDLKSGAKLEVDISARLGMQDIGAFMPDMRVYMRAVPAATPLLATVKATGTLSNAKIEKIDIKLPGIIAASANGAARNPMDLKKMDAKLHFNGQLGNPRVISNFVEVEAIKLPMLSIVGNVAARCENYAADFKLTTEHGDLAGNGKVGMNSERYEANVNVRNLNIGALIGDTAIGKVTATLNARGAGFDPEKRGAQTDVKLKIDDITYNKQTLRDINLAATLRNGDFTIDANSMSSPLNFHIAGNGTIAEDNYEVKLSADLKNVDLMALGMSPTTNQGSGRIILTGKASPRRWLYDVAMEAENINWHLPEQDINLGKGASARMIADADKTQCTLSAEGVSMRFIAATGLKSVVETYTDVTLLMAEAIKDKRLDVAAIESKLPPFILKANVDGKGIASDLLSATGIQFGKINADISKDSVLQGKLSVNSLKKDAMRLDTITFKMKSRSNLIDYQVHVGNRAGVMDEFADVNMSGYVGDNRVSAYLVQHNIKKKMGYRVGFTASLADSIVSLRFTPLKATIAYLPWQFNIDNYVDCNIHTMMVDANLEASSDQSKILLRTDQDEKGNDALHLNLTNIKVQDFLKMSLNAPPVSASVNSDINLRYTGKAFVGKGSLDITDLAYDRRRVGNISLTLAAGLGNKGKSGGKVGMTIDGAEAAAVQFILAPDSVDPNGSMIAERLKLNLTSFPLSIANPFFPAGSMSVAGSLNGSMDLSGSLTKPKLNGTIAGDSIGVSVDMLGTTFKVGNEPIEVADNELKLDNLHIYAVNSNPLSINGSVDMSDFTNMALDLTAKATNMQLTGGKKNKGDISGNIFVDLDASVKGPMTRLNINAALNVLPATDFTYYMAMGSENMLTGAGSSDQVVRFINFADSTDVAKADSLASAMSMRVTAKAVISQGTQMAVDLGGNGKVKCNPSGTFNYFQNFMGDMKLNGTLYTGDGYARYNVPLLGNKVFDFDRDSHITWNGDIMNPSLSIKATDQLKTNIQGNGNTRLVNFLVTLMIGNTLTAPSLSFDLSTDDDMSISNELQSMTPDQRQQQAMNLLLTGMYVGPGAKSVNSNLVTGNLYSLLTSQLNAFAAQNIKGVDINFGVNQYEVGANGSTSTNTSYSYQVSKSLINNRFKIVVGGNYSTDASADENFQQNLISDIAFEYILRQTNTMSLNAKLFRHTGFESILEGEITETGVGLSLRRRLAYFTEITHFGLSKLWKKPKKAAINVEVDSIAAARSDSSNIEAPNERMVEEESTKTRISEEGEK